MKNIGNLDAEQVRKWATKEVELVQARARVTELAGECDEFRERYEGRMAPSDDPRDAGKNVKVARAGGWQIRLTRFLGGERFSIRDYRTAGHEVTAAMQDHISPGGEQVKVTPKRLKGPTKPGAVEPA